MNGEYKLYKKNEIYKKKKRVLFKFSTNLICIHIPTLVLII